MTEKRNGLDCEPWGPPATLARLRWMAYELRWAAVLGLVPLLLMLLR